MKIYTVAFKDEGRFQEDIFTNLKDAEEWAIERTNLRKDVECYINIYSKDSAFDAKGLWYDGFEIFYNGTCIRA